jgi:steroid 5-alpha reductase family enzyme
MMTEIPLQAAAVITAMMVAVWTLSLPLRNVSIIDLVWGLGFVLVAWISYFTGEPAHRDALTPILVSCWGIRLSAHLAWRNHGVPEDRRYRAMRERGGRRFPIVSLATVFGLQGAVMWCVAWPLMSAQMNPPANRIAQIAGAVLWGIGFVYESVADWQLARFKSRPEHAGRVLDRGLWRFSRHPNYFGEILVGWGLFLSAWGAGAAAWTVFSPLLMTFLLIKVSGVTLLEKSLLRDKPEYAAYRWSTSPLIPWFPRSGSPDNPPNNNPSDHQESNLSDPSPGEVD